MAIRFNLRNLEEKTLHLEGELPAAELELESLDELIHVHTPLAYDVEVQRIDDAVLVQGSLRLTLECECGRCLKRYPHPILLEEWACHIPLEGEEKAPIVNDCVDLTPFIREDMVLAFPQHPLCKPECSGLAGSQNGPEKSPAAAAKPDVASSAWAALDKLKL